MPVSNDKRDTVRVDLKESIAGEVILMHPEEIEDKYLELIKHELTRLTCTSRPYGTTSTSASTTTRAGTSSGEAPSRAALMMRDIVAAHGEPRRYLRVRGYV